MKAALGRLVAIAVMAAPLGACTSFLGFRLVKAVPDVRPATRSVHSPAAAGVSASDAAKAHLTAGNPGSAVEMYRRALAQGEPVAPALNGLGVAYARLGRDDLALRYFEQAVAAAPADARYSTNLARLMQTSRSFAVAPASADRRDRPVAAHVPQSASRTVTGSLQRISRSEVTIVVADPAPVSGSRHDRNYPGFKPVIRIEIANSPAGTPAKPPTQASVKSTPAVALALAGAPAQPKQFIRNEIPDPD